jgi:hypothetical protein
MLYNELEQGDILSGVRWRLALLAYTDILLCSIWAMRRIRQTPVTDPPAPRGGMAYGLASSPRWSQGRVRPRWGCKLHTRIPWLMDVYGIASLAGLRESAGKLPSVFAVQCR